MANPFWNPYPADTAKVMSLIAPSDKVLDVGGGWKPFNRANVVIDLMAYEERGGGGSIGGGKEHFSRETWIQMDICGTRWPFEDQSFDFVYCGEVLEDVRDPLWVCQELQRVAKRGYIETPTMWIESQFGVDGQENAHLYPGYHKHQWLVDLTSGGLVFIPKLIYLATTRFVDEERSHNYRRYHRIWTQPFFWEGSFSAEVMQYPWTEGLLAHLRKYFEGFDYQAIAESDRSIEQLPTSQFVTYPVCPGGHAIGIEEIAAVTDVLQSGALFRYFPGSRFSKGKVDEFEREFAATMGTEFALAVNSGTSALICGLAGVGIGPGDEVLVPAYTFVASALAVVALGATPIMVEVDASLTMDPEDLERTISPRTKAIMPVHMRGVAARMDKLLPIAEAYELKIVEDVAQACGAHYAQRPLGSIGNAGAFSLQLFKIITTGEGGVLVTNDRNVFERARIYHDPPYPGPVSIERFPGHNFHASEIQGALGLAQLKRLEKLIGQMRAHKRRLREELAHLEPLSLRDVPDLVGEAGTQLITFLPTADMAQQFVAALAESKIHVRTLYDGTGDDWHVYPRWKELLRVTVEAGRWRDCPRTLDLLSRAVALDINPRFIEQDITYIIDSYRKAARKVA